MKRKCVIHYQGNCSYSKLKDISEVNERRMKDAKSERERLGGENHHKEQCDTIPDSVNNELHGIHLEHCYKKFTSILSAKQNVTAARISRRQSSSGSTANIYPDICQICKKTRVQFKGKKVSPIVITTFDAQHTIKEAAKAKDPILYEEIKYEYLITREFKIHAHCRCNLTRGFGKKSRELENQNEVSKHFHGIMRVSCCSYYFYVMSLDQFHFLQVSNVEEEENDSSPYSVGNFEDVKDYVNNRILKGQEAVYENSS